jgi:tetratricopeptide (TPR) repeat protein
MKKRMLFIIFQCLNIFCINLVQAQTALQISTSAPELPVKSLPVPVTPAAAAGTTTSVPTTVSSKYAEYQSYCRQNDFDEALIYSPEQKIRRMNLLTEKLKKNPDSKLVINTTIKEYLTQKEPKSAELFFYKNKSNLSQKDIVIWESEFDVQKKLPAAAVTKLENYIAENKSSKRALLKLAAVRKGMEYFSESAEIYKDLQAADKSADYSAELCEVYTLDSHHKDAEKNCLLASARHPKNPMPEVYLGISYREQELFDESQKHFEISIQRRPTEFGLTCLGELFYLKKDAKKTLEYLHKAVSKNKFSYRAQLGLALAEFNDRKYIEALDHFKQACVLGQKDTLEMRKSHQILEEQKSAHAAKYYDEIQNCKLNNL